ncbi:MAG TPA: 50S ribosomal protein L11 methyltransferase [Legionellales bacterium]|nr:50S ribosomal protein L11 methyltransferase [Legionellales bacterium]HCA90214.1 50S ribosomal protein L11 methyltransferase [Legionellales bacterium]
MTYQLQIEQCMQPDAENLSDLLEALGALAVTLTDTFDDPILEPPIGTTPLWPVVSISSLFAEEQLAMCAKEHVLNIHPNLQCAVTLLPERDWERAWMDDFKPRACGKRLWICPSWLTPPDENAANLILDPGLAFGTGTHPTTYLCLQWLDGYNLTQKKLIDYGCGSGILALAALKLGAHHAYALDIDPQAHAATVQNAQLNHLTTQISVHYPDDFICEPVELLIANILLAPLLTLKSTFHALLQAQGQLVVSGILTTQVNTLVREYDELFAHQATLSQDDWALVIFTKKA